MWSMILVLSSRSFLACVVVDEGVTVVPEGEESSSGFVELIANDPLRQSYDFLRADYGHAVQNGQVVNVGQHIDYGSYHDGELTVGIQGSEVGCIADLGTDDDLAMEYGVEQTVGGGQGFAALTMEDATLAGSTDDWQQDACDHLQPQMEHVYALRILDETSDLDLVVKLFVVSIDDDAVAFEWVRR